MSAHVIRTIGYAVHGVGAVHRYSGGTLVQKVHIILLEDELAAYLIVVVDDSRWRKQ